MSWLRKRHIKSSNHLPCLENFFFWLESALYNKPLRVVKSWKNGKKISHRQKVMKFDRISNSILAGLMHACYSLEISSHRFTRHRAKVSPLSFCVKKDWRCISDYHLVAVKRSRSCEFKWNRELPSLRSFNTLFFFLCSIHFICRVFFVDKTNGSLVPWSIACFAISGFDSFFSSI